MRPYTSLAQKSNVCVEAFKTEDIYVPPSRGTNAGDHLEPISTRDATKRTTEILYVDYKKKANLPAIAKKTGKRLSLIEQSNLLQLLTKNEELFDGTLGGFDTDLAKVDLQIGAKAYP